MRPAAAAQSPAALLVGAHEHPLGQRLLQQTALALGRDGLPDPLQVAVEALLLVRRQPRVHHGLRGEAPQAQHQAAPVHVRGRGVDGVGGCGCGCGHVVLLVALLHVGAHAGLAVAGAALSVLEEVGLVALAVAPLAAALAVRPGVAQAEGLRGAAVEGQLRLALGRSAPQHLGRSRGLVQPLRTLRLVQAVVRQLHVRHAQLSGSPQSRADGLPGVRGHEGVAVQDHAPRKAGALGVADGFVAGLVLRGQVQQAGLVGRHAAVLLRLEAAHQDVALAHAVREQAGVQQVEHGVVPNAVQHPLLHCSSQLRLVSQRIQGVPQKLARTLQRGHIIADQTIDCHELIAAIVNAIELCRGPTFVE